VLPSDERAALRPLDVDAEAAARLQRTPESDRFRLSLDPHGLELVVLDRVARRAVRDLSDDERACGRRLLQARGSVHDIACDHSLSPLGACAQCDNGLAGRHGRSDLELEIADRLEDPQRRPNCPLGVVLVRDRCAEDGHDGVSDELLHRAAVALDLPLEQLVVRPEPGADVLGVGLIRRGRVADQVTEEHGNQLPLLGRNGGDLEGSAAREAEARDVRVLLTAARAGEGHQRRYLQEAGSRRRPLDRQVASPRRARPRARSHSRALPA
jgi:hypothetical protein